ncbi:hypothetical protein [Melittangium boletus]|uniref:hypothetical protein n=1 Tax=Melittangium boletus TaxID=83453 RepID=UPI003DA49DAB
MTYSLIYLLKQRDVLLGELQEFDLDWPWARCHFASTKAFDPLRPLFEREHQLSSEFSDTSDSSSDDDEIEQLLEQIDSLGLTIECPRTGKVFTRFGLHIWGLRAEFKVIRG